jgi:thiamine transport system ATP-binding protein
MTEPNAAIELRNVEIRFETTTLHFDCTIAAGGIVAVAGASGSGKSTLFHLIAGFEDADHGEIRVLGQNAANQAPSERPVSMIFQDNNLFAHLDVATNVGLGIDPALRLTDEDRKRIEDALRRVGLEGFGRRLPPRFPAANASGSRLPAHLCGTAPSCCWMNHLLPSTPGCAPACARFLANCTRKKATPF